MQVIIHIFNMDLLIIFNNVFVCVFEYSVFESKRMTGI